MKKFITQTIKGKTGIYECEVSIVFPRPWQLKDGEELFQVEAPAQFKGEHWYSMFFRDTQEECKVQIETSIRGDYERKQIKCCAAQIECPPLTEEDIRVKLNQVEVFLL